MKVSFFSKRVIIKFGNIATWTLAIFSVAVIFFPVTEDCKWVVFSALILFHILLYLWVWYRLNSKKIVKLKIRNTKVIIKEGDIFKEHGKKVIAFNEYFDTRVDDIIIAKGTLNGKFIENYVEDIPALDQHITEYLSKKTPVFADQQRSGKKICYDLGTIVPYGDFFLLAYSKFDENNRAYLDRDDVAKVYLNMWNEIDIHKACKSISIPVLGSSGMVRKMDYTAQQLLELLIWSFRISGVNITRLATLNIIVHPTMVDSIDFVKLKDYSD